jgi:hypothetical protein
MWWVGESELRIWTTVVVEAAEWGLSCPSRGDAV